MRGIFQGVHVRRPWHGGGTIELPHTHVAAGLLKMPVNRLAGD
jgi:hypothetical protein